MQTMEAIKLFVDDEGSRGELPVVFLHSLAGNTQQWTAQLDFVRQTRRALAMDLRGHGKSPGAPNGDFNIETLAQDVQAAIAELGIERFILAGHSMGGSVAVAVAGAIPEQVAGVLLVDPSGDATQMPAEQVQGLLAALQSEAYTAVIEDYWQQILAGATEATQTNVMYDLRQTDKETVVGCMQALFSFNPLPALQNYNGARLSVITKLNELPSALHKLVPDFPHILIEGTGHWLQLDKPEAFNQILADFVTAVDS